jgi:hypothetical protein
MSNYSHQFLLHKLPIKSRQFANRFGKLMIKNPFWVLVISSVGLHIAFAFLAPSPLKKSETPRNEEILKNSPIPLIKLPANLPNPKSKGNNPLLSNLFVKPSVKTQVPTNTPNPQNNLENPLTSFDSSELLGLPPLMGSDLPFGVPPLLNNPITPPQFVKQQPLFSNIQSALSQIDNSKPSQNSSNLRSDLKSGLKDLLPETSKPSPVKNPPPDNKTATSNLKNTDVVPANKPVTTNAPVTRTATTQTNATTPSGDKPTNNQESPTTSNNTPANTNTPIPITGTQILSFLATDKRIQSLIDNNRLITTQIAPEEALIPNPEQSREKGVSWIPPKVKNIAGKRGVILYYWIVAPSGEIQLAGYTSGDRELVDADQELVNIVLDTVKQYEFQPIAESKAGMYRLVTARYSFPYIY